MIIPSSSFQTFLWLWWSISLFNFSVRLNNYNSQVLRYIISAGQLPDDFLRTHWQLFNEWWLPDKWQLQDDCLWSDCRTTSRWLLRAWSKLLESIYKISVRDVAPVIYILLPETSEWKQLQNYKVRKLQKIFCMLWKVTMWVGGVQNVRRCSTVRVPSGD